MTHFADWQNELERLCEESGLGIDNWPPEDEDRDWFNKDFTPEERFAAWVGTATLGAADRRKKVSGGVSVAPDNARGIAAGKRSLVSGHRPAGNRIKADQPFFHPDEVYGFPCQSASSVAGGGATSFLGRDVANSASPSGFSESGGFTVSAILASACSFLVGSAAVAALWGVSWLLGAAAAIAISLAVVTAIGGRLHGKAGEWGKLPPLHVTHTEKPTKIEWGE